MEYEKAKFLRYIQGDLFLKMQWDKRQKTTPAEEQDSLLRVYFNTYVKGNSVAEREYSCT